MGEEDKPEWDDGFFLIDKPAGMTSFAIVRRIRRLLGIKKVGHAGTLDPFATGLLIVCVGRPATRQIELFMAGRKTYQARLQLGVETTTQDPEGSVTATRPVPALTETALTACLRRHVGPQMQAPPPFSAAKHRGKPLYVYARQGVQVKKPAKPIEIFRLELLGYDAGTSQLSVEVECSRGTYIRVVAADIGRELGCGAHLAALRRIRSGPFMVEDSLSGEELFADSGSQMLRLRRRNLAEVLQPAG
ncbi:MAG: tRNA pseudouridine(55) synthase TruB [Proteobacteria bacterium]|nr:tRNA pseudouridine(55) synthase TruB [Pseudomonadota bacterium]